MKSVLLTFCAFFMLSSAFAQNGEKTYVERSPDHTKKMTTELSLTSEQSAKLMDLNLRTAKKLDEANLDKATFEIKRAEIEKEYEAELAGILTGDQYKRYEALKMRREKAKNTKQN